MGIETLPFDAAEFLSSREAQHALVSEAFETGDAVFIVQALGVVARARGMEKLTDVKGFRDVLNGKAGDELPDLATVLQVAQALGMRLQAVEAV